MRYVILSVVLMSALAGCDQSRPVSPKYDPVADANDQAAKVVTESGWILTNKDVVSQERDYTRLKMTFTLDERRMVLDVDSYHTFFGEFDSLKVGEPTGFIHMSHLGGGLPGNPVTFLAPNTPVTRQYYKEKDYSGY